jgi:hypothetical protein
MMQSIWGSYKRGPEASRCTHIWDIGALGKQLTVDHDWKSSRLKRFDQNLSLRFFCVSRDVSSVYSCRSKSRSQVRHMFHVDAEDQG